MKTTLGYITALALGFGTAWAQDTGFYVKGDLGGNITQDINLKEFFGPVAPGSKIALDPGFRAGLAGGYQVTEWFAGEVEAGVMENRIHSITDATRIHDANFANIPFLLNARLQWPTPCPFTPYIGAGVGFSESIFDVGNITINGIDMHGSRADAVFAYQAFAGIRYRLNDRMGLNLEYRYFVAASPSWQADFTFNTVSDTVRFGEARTHAVSLAFDFHF